MSRQTGSLAVFSPRRLAAVLTAVLALMTIGGVAGAPAFAAAPGNDNYADAEVLPGVTGSLRATTAGATTESGEVNHGGIQAEATIWYRWTPVAPGYATFSTEGSPVGSSALGIYEQSFGDTLADATGVAASSSCQADDPFADYACVTFYALAEHTYFIAVSKGIDEGDVQVNWQQTPRSTVPLNVTGSATSSTSVTVSWSPPANDGAPAVTAYRVRSTSADDTAVTTVTVSASTRSYTFTGLSPGTGYSLRVAAMSASGAGAATGVSVTTTTGTLPGAPTSVTATSTTSTTAVLNWGAPATSGSSAITGYLVSRDGGTAGQTGWSTTVAATVRTQSFANLRAGATYNLSVAAINAQGTGPATTVPVTVITVPGPPTIGTATPGTSGGAITANAAWTPPGNTGGSAVTGYRVYALRMSSSGTVLGTTTSAVQPATARSLSMTLPQSGNYRFTVAAINAAGVSAQSAQSNLVAGR